MTPKYLTREGDVLDDIVNRYYGRQDAGLVEFVLEANPGLAEYGAELPASLTVYLPTAPAPKPATTIQLFS